MKKSLLLTLLILTISFSCQEQENTVEPEVNFDEASTFLSNMFSQTIQHSISNAKFEMNENQLEFSNSDIIGNYLKENYFPELEPLELSTNSQSNARISEEDSHFTEEQQSFISDLDETMNNISSAEEFYASIDEYRNRVINNSAMSDEQKIEMLAMVEYSNALHEYLITGGISEIKEILPEVNNVNGRSARVSQQRPKYEILECEEDEDNPNCGGGGCSIDWRALWSDAVVGFFGGVVGGCYAGATGGTIVLGPLGTVTGCVGVGMVSGAGGFISGAGYSAISQMIQTCGR